MRTFTLHLQSATQYERIEGVASFVGEDASGGFGILAGHARVMTALVFGLARFRQAEGPWQYLALPGALLYGVGDDLFLSTRRYLRDEDAARIGRALDQELLAEETALRTVKDSLRRLEEELFKRLWRLGRAGPV